MATRHGTHRPPPRELLSVSPLAPRLARVQLQLVLLLVGLQSESALARPEHRPSPIRMLRPTVSRAQTASTSWLYPPCLSTLPSDLTATGTQALVAHTICADCVHSHSQSVPEASNIDVSPVPSMLIVSVLTPFPQTAGTPALHHHRHLAELKAAPLLDLQCGSPSKQARRWLLRRKVQPAKQGL